MNEAFRKLAHRASQLVGTSYAFIAAVVLCVLWAVLGPVFGFSDTWQLVINTATTVLTFLAVFLIQNTQNRESKTVQLKLDELLRAITAARTGMASIEDLSDSDLAKLQAEFTEMAGKAGDGVPAGESPRRRVATSREKRRGSQDSSSGGVKRATGR